MVSLDRLALPAQLVLLANVENQDSVESQDLLENLELVDQPDNGESKVHT